MKINIVSFLLFESHTVTSDTYFIKISIEQKILVKKIIVP